MAESEILKLAKAELTHKVLSSNHGIDKKIVADFERIMGILRQADIFRDAKYSLDQPFSVVQPKQPKLHHLVGGHSNPAQ